MKNYIKILFFISSFVLKGADGFSSSSSNVESKIIKFKEFVGPATSVKIAPNNKLLAASGVDGKIIVWDLISGKKLNEFIQNSYIRAISWSPDSNKLAAIYRNKELIIWDVNTNNGSILGSAVEQNLPLAIAWSPVEESKIAVALDNVIQIYEWNAELLDINVLKVLNGHKNAIHSIAWSPKGSRLVSGSSDKTLKVWNVIDRREIKNISETDSINKVAYSPNGQNIIYSMVDKTVTILNDLYKRVEKLNIYNNATALEWSPNSNLFAYGNLLGEIKICNLEGYIIKTIKNHDKAITELSWSTNGDFIASSSTDGSVVISPVEISIIDLLKSQMQLYFENDALYLNNLELTSLSGLQELSNINMINELHINYNNIKNLGNNLQNLRHLKLIDLSDNKIETIEIDNFKGLENLTSIILSDNRITTISADFLRELKNQHKNLADFIILNNPLSDETKSILEKAKSEFNISIYF